MDAATDGTAPVARALIRVLGLSSGAHLRADTPLSSLGVDSLALMLVADAMAESGYVLDERRAHAASTVGDLADCCHAREVVA